MSLVSYVKCVYFQTFNLQSTTAKRERRSFVLGQSLIKGGRENKMFSIKKSCPASQLNVLPSVKACNYTSGNGFWRVIMEIVVGREEDGGIESSKNMNILYGGRRSGSQLLLRCITYFVCIEHCS